MRIIEGEYDDRPLQGPWSRRRESPPGPAGNIPETGGGMYGSESEGSEDRPLQGPWSRRREPEPDPVEADPEESMAWPEKEREKERVRIDAAPLPGRPAEVRGAADDSPPAAEKTAPAGCYPAPERERNLIRNMFCPPGLYMGVVMAEILGGRGGRHRRR